MCDDCPFDDALELIDEIIDVCGELPQEADDFAGGVEERCHSINEWIQKNHHVTTKQMTALNNMLEGCGRWMERDA